MRVFFQPAREYSLGVVVNVAPSDITIRTTAGVAVQAALVHTVDGAGHWYVTTMNALYTQGVKYLLWTTTTTTLGVVTEDHPFEHVNATTADVTGPGPSAIAVTGVTDTTITVAIDPPHDADYDHTTLYALSTDGVTVVVVSSSGPTVLSVTIPGLPSGEDGWVVGIAYDVSGNPSILGVGSIAAWQTLPAPAPAYPLYVEHYFDDETTPYATETLDQEGDGAQRLAGAGAHIGQGRRYRVRVYTWAPVKAFELRGVDILMATRPGQVGGLRNSLGNRQ